MGDATFALGGERTRAGRWPVFWSRAMRAMRAAGRLLGRAELWGWIFCGNKLLRPYPGRLRSSREREPLPPDQGSGVAPIVGIYTGNDGCGVGG